MNVRKHRTYALPAESWYPTGAGRSAPGDRKPVSSSRPLPGVPASGSLDSVLLRR